MKVFRINAYVLLPEDFEGSIDDAYQELCKIRDEPNRKPVGVTERDRIEAEEREKQLSIRVAHEAFFINQRLGARAVCEAGVWELNRNWVRRDKNPAGAISDGHIWVK